MPIRSETQAGIFPLSASFSSLSHQARKADVSPPPETQGACRPAPLCFRKTVLWRRQKVWRIVTGMKSRKRPASRESPKKRTQLQLRRALRGPGFTRHDKPNPAAGGLVRQMSHLLALDTQVAVVRRGRRSGRRNALGHANSRLLERLDLRRVVGDEPDFLHSKLFQNGARQLVGAKIRFKAELLIGFHRVRAPILKLIGPELVQQANAAAFLMFVNQQAAALFGDRFQRELQLGAAIAAQAVKDVAGQALRVNADQRRRGAL